MITYKVNLKSHFNHLKYLIIFIFIFSLMPLMMVVIYGKKDLVLFLFMGIVLFLIVAAPQFLLHYTYYKANVAQKFIYCLNKNIIKIVENSLETSFSSNDISKVICYMTSANHIRMGNRFPWSNYHYSQIHLFNGQCLIITSLLVPDIESFIEPQRILVKRTIFPILMNRNNNNFINRIDRYIFGK